MNRNKFTSQRVLKGLSTQDVADYLGIHGTTLYQKLSKGSFTLNELKMLKELLELDSQQFFDIFFDEKVSE